MSDRLFAADRINHFIRPRITALLEEAVMNPLTIVCAGAGYGKTQAVFDFTREQTMPAAWIQLSELDNAGSRFWKKYIQAAAWDDLFAEQCKSLGFPDTEDKLNQYLALRKGSAPDRRRLFVLDDVHLIHNPDMLHFFKYRLREKVKNLSVILICRETSHINFSGFQVRGLVPNINESELRFTETELGLYLHRQGVATQKHVLRDILRDTGGWAFSVNLVARSLKRSPGYSGYARTAMRQNIFKLMETEVFDVVSKRLQRFLVRLSLIDHLSADLIDGLTGGDVELLNDLRRQSAYIRFDSEINAYLIHHLFLDFLRTRQELLTSDEIRETYRAAAGWCAANGFEMDAAGYYEKVEDYREVISLLAGLPIQMPLDSARYAAELFERAPARLSEEIELFAVTHVRVMIRLGRWRETVELMERYEKQFLLLPEGEPLRNKTLGVIYYSWGNIRALISTIDHRYDFDVYYGKMGECLEKYPVDPGIYADMPLGMWASLTGSSRQGAPQEYIEAAARAAKPLSRHWGGSTAGVALCRGELLFYQDKAQEAESFFMDSLRQAQEKNQFESEYKVLFYLMRIALSQGDIRKARNRLQEMENRLEEKTYSHRFSNYDAALSWYYCFLRLPEMIPAWLKENFSPYIHAYFIENLANQMKARYHYLTRNYPPLLAYIEEMKRRESILYGRVEMLATEACVRFRMKQQSAALDVLKKAYEESAPNEIITPFIELGKDMRTLSNAALHEPNCCGLPVAWVEKIKRRSVSHAKYQSLLISRYKKECEKERDIMLSVRENEILRDLYYGLSRPEIAVKNNLSINTVNFAVNNIFNKLDAHSVVDVVRIAAEKKLV